MALLTGAGTRFSFGAYIKPLETEFQASRGIMGGISFLSFIVYGLSQPFVGSLVDRYGKMLAAIYALRVLTILFLLTVGDHVALMIFGIAFGLVDFATVAPTSALSAELFSGSSLGLVYGWISLAHQLGAASGSYIPGLLYDWTGGYQASFLLSAVMLVFASVVSLRLSRKGILNTAHNILK